MDQDCRSPSCRPGSIPVGIVVALAAVTTVASPASDPAHEDRTATRPRPWPSGVVPCDVSALSPDQRALAFKAMRRWMDTGARINFVERSNQTAYVRFTGRTDAGNNTSHVGYEKGVRIDVNITAFWWRQGEWMPAHELGHALGFFHEHSRWDRDLHLKVHYEHIKPGRYSDYDWVARDKWPAPSVPYDPRSIMHYRICWASNCEDQCRDGDGASPCAVIEPLDRSLDPIIGQWQDNKISDLDAERARRFYGRRRPPGGGG
jgi:Astacin (Peptidase family M12A)